MTEVLTPPTEEPPVDDGAVSSDGRKARGQRTRRRVAESLVTLLEAGEEEPTARRIAETAGVSLRLVFHHFDDMEDLYRAVSELQYERHWRDLVSVPATGPLARRAERLIRLRTALYEQVAPVRRAGLRRTNTSAALAQLLDLSNERCRHELVVTFGPELIRRPGANGVELLDAVDAAASWETWERLRRSQGLGVVAARKVMVRTVLALLSAPVG